MPVKCQRCRRKYYIDLNFFNRIWEKYIKPEHKPAGAGLVCGVCAMRRLEKLKQHGAFEARHIVGFGKHVDRS